MTEFKQLEAPLGPNVKDRHRSERTKAPKTDPPYHESEESESLESSEPIYSDPVDDFASSSHDEEYEDDIDIQGSLKNKKKVINIGDHIKLRKKGIIGGKIVCDYRGCHAVDYSDESSL